MHQILCIPEIVRNIFGRSSPTTTSTPQRDNADLAALARTCTALKVLALDLLWEELDDVSPLARCLPEACRTSYIGEAPDLIDWKARCYGFSRPLNKTEWNTLRDYARRVRFIRDRERILRGTTRERRIYLEENVFRTIFNPAPFTDPLFPNLRSLYWKSTIAFSVRHAAVPSLTSLHLDLKPRCFPRPRLATEPFDAFGDHCPHIEELVVHSLGCHIADINISSQVYRWPNLRQVHCQNVALNMGAIVHLSTVFNLKSLAFTAHVDAIHNLSHFGSILVFPNLAELLIRSESLDTTTSLLSHIRLPAIESLAVTISNYVLKRQIQAYWAGIREACSSNILTCLRLQGWNQEDAIPILAEERLLRLTREDLYPCRAFAELRELHIGFDCSVGLTDADLLELASPRMEKLAINSDWGWDEGGGITLSGLVRLLQKCPSLSDLSLAIDTQTFTEIPEGLDVSFPPREQLKMYFLDSYIQPEFIPGLVSVFMALGLDSSMFTCWNIRFKRYEARSLWKEVQDELRSRTEKR